MKRELYAINIHKDCSSATLYCRQAAIEQHFRAIKLLWEEDSVHLPKNGTP